MSTMDVSVVLKLIDQLSDPARRAAKSMVSLRDAVERSARSGRGLFEELPRNLQRAADAARLTGSQLHALRQRYLEVTSAIRGMKAAEGLSIRKNWIEMQTAQLNQMARAAREAETSTRRAVGARGSHGGGLLTGYGLAKVGAGYIGLHEAGRVMRTGIDQAFSLQQTRALLQAGGETPETIKAVVDQARSMASTNHMFSVAEHAHSILKLRSAVGDMHEAIALAPAFQKANAVLSAARDIKPGMHRLNPEDQAYDMARALEIKGVTRLGEKAITSYANSMTKAIIGMSGQIDAGDFHNTFKYGRAATRGWSQDFVENYLPTLMNEFKAKGGRSGGVTGPGNALMSAYSTIVDGRIGKKILPKWREMGLLDKQGHVVGRDEFILNPYLWMQKYMLGSLKKKLGDNPTEKSMLKELGGLFSNRVAAQMAQIMVLATSQFEKDRELIQRAHGIEALRLFEESSPQAAMQGLSASFKDLMSSVVDSSPAMTALNGLRGRPAGAGGERRRNHGSCADHGPRGPRSARNGAPRAACVQRCGRRPPQRHRLTATAVTPPWRQARPSATR